MAMKMKSAVGVAITTTGLLFVSAQYGSAAVVEKPDAWRSCSINYTPQEKRAAQLNARAISVPQISAQMATAYEKRFPEIRALADVGGIDGVTDNQQRQIALSLEQRDSELTSADVVDYLRFKSESRLAPEGFHEALVEGMLPNYVSSDEPWVTGDPDDFPELFSELVGESDDEEVGTQKEENGDESDERTFTPRWEYADLARYEENRAEIERDVAMTDAVRRKLAIDEAYRLPQELSVERCTYFDSSRGTVQVSFPIGPVDFNSGGKVPAGRDGSSRSTFILAAVAIVGGLAALVPSLLQILKNSDIRLPFKMPHLGSEINAPRM